MSDPAPTSPGRRSPNPIDVHVGSRVRERRLEVGMSQQKLGEALGVTFQQVQKYEKGTNRIGASRMQQICETLGVPINYFYQGVPVANDALTEPSSVTAAVADPAVSFDAASDESAASGPEGAALNAAFARIRSARTRARVLELVKTLADEQD